MKLQKIKFAILMLMEAKGISDDDDEKLDKAIDSLFEVEWKYSYKIDEELDDAARGV